MGVLSQQNGRPALTADQTPGIFARIAAMQNPGYMVAQGVNKITNPGYPVDDALRGWANNAPALQPTLGGVGRSFANNGLNQASEFLTALQRGDIDAVMNSSLFPMGGMTVFHGSPHKFDKFDLSKIGTGEGAQAYGHGLYFAENPVVANSYKTVGQADDFKKAVDAAWPELRKLSPFDDDFITFGPTRKRIGREEFQKLYESNPDAVWSDLSPQVRAAVEKSLAGTLYEVDIPDEAIAKMLDWDKPLSEQSESVKSLLRGSEIAPDESVWSQYTGQQLYEGEMQAGGPYKGSGWASSEAQKAVSGKLRDLGIPGLKYFDGGSRKAGEGTRNFVLFDENLAKIIKRE